MMKKREKLQDDTQYFRKEYNFIKENYKKTTD